MSASSIQDLWRDLRSYPRLCGVALWLLAELATTALAQTLPDPRDGYHAADFQTRTRQVERVSDSAATLDYAALADQGALGLPALTRPIDNALAELGHRLFFERRLSFNDTLSCAMCHVPEQAFAQNELATPGRDRRAQRQTQCAQPTQRGVSQALVSRWPRARPGAADLVAVAGTQRNGQPRHGIGAAQAEYNQRLCGPLRAGFSNPA